MTASLGNPLVVALDVATAEEAVRLAGELAPAVGAFKVGLELLMGPGPATVAAIRDLGKPVLVDAKLHDIPTTVRRAARQLGRVGARWVTIHGAGGGEMVEAAIEGLAEGAAGHPAGVLVVTVLTSLGPVTLAAVGVQGSPGRQTARMSKLAAEAGAEGVVCSVRELGDVAQVAPELLRVTPGIRPAGDPAHDQVRTATPEEAVARGADMIVVGRPVTRAEDPRAEADRIVASLLARR
ncbi:MAG: orotidine-5'-phosphate decarboxylase [Acidimicrobiia bacterium]